MSRDVFLWHAKERINYSVYVYKMARIHARRKGDSGSSKPLESKASNWVSVSSKELEELIVKLSKDGNSPSMIGLILRDQYGIPDVRPVLKMKLTKVLEKNKVGLKVPEDLQNLINKAVKLHDHSDKHTRDVHNRRSMMLVESKIRRLAKYYKRKGVLAKDWRYDVKQARLLASK